ncbi:hypothetical protein BJ878DRAFT_552142 [Calycina marina]|uniref:Uncharacterized protein n=1 Tax=Calycina marina TaxID=1763456 RepID=A0A9P8CJX5_9HELO|nr:hypothetical protein BJ878DRAFT_552142 [Calycina marina]
MSTSDVATPPHNLPITITKDLVFEGVNHLVALGSSKVIRAVRNLELGEKAKIEIESSAGITGVAEVWEFDLTVHDSVKSFATKALTLDRIDALIENAGVAVSQGVIAEGHMLAVTANVFSTFLLAKPNIQPHIAILGNSVRFDCKGEWESVRDDPLTKLDTFQPELKTLSRTGVVLNQVCPGICVTAFSRDVPPAFKQQIGEMLAGVESHGNHSPSCVFDE